MFSKVKVPFWWVYLFYIKISRGQNATTGMQFQVKRAPRPRRGEFFFHPRFFWNTKEEISMKTRIEEVYIYIYTYVCVKCGPFTVSLTNKIVHWWLGHAAMPVTILQG